MPPSCSRSIEAARTSVVVCRQASRRCCSRCGKDALDVVRVLLKAGADANETDPGRGCPPARYGGPLPRAGISALLLAVMNAHFELAAALLDAGANPNADLTGYTPLHAITVVRKPGVGDNDPAPEGSGSMTSLELVKKLVAHGANVNATMTKRVNLNNTRANELGATPFMLAALTADAELMTTLAALGANPAAHERREEHAADAGGRTRDALSWRRRRHGERSARGRAGRCWRSAPT